jgi:hypothetical protein
MRRIVFATAIALVLAGTAVAITSIMTAGPAAAGCTRRC